MSATPRRKSFLLGLGATTLCLAVLLRWDHLAPLLLGGRPLGYDQQPGWLKLLQQAIGLLPWLLGAVLVGLKRRGGTDLSLGYYAFGALMPQAVFLIWLFGASAVSDWWHREHFDAAAWRVPADTAEVFWPTRLRMVDDLLARDLLSGLTRDSVLSLLGPANRGERGDSSVSYYLGPERDWLRIDSEDLVIQFGPSGRVVDARIVRD